MSGRDLRIGPLEQGIDQEGRGINANTLALVNGRALADILSMSEAIELVSTAMKEVSEGRVVAPERGGVAVGKGTLVLMQGAMSSIDRFGVKVLSLFAAAAGEHLPGHQGMMLLFDAEDGRPLCALESHAVTALRTAAASAVATRALSRSDSRSVALIGCGALAPLHAQALCQVRPIEEIIVWGRSAEKARRLADECGERLGKKLTVAGSVREAVERADIVCTLTSAQSPILEGRWLRPGQHLNLVGASTRAAREVDDEAVARSRFIVDSRSHALSQAGELRHALESGRVQEQHLAAEIGEVLAGRVHGRDDRSTITLYKSLGHVAQDIRVADAVFERLDRSPHVVRVNW